MTWIKSDSDLLSHPKVKIAARKLDISKITMTGHLYALWHWVFKHAPDGDITTYSLDLIAEEVGWESDSGTFFGALAECGIGGGYGFIEKREDGSIVLHDWEEHCGSIYKKRKNDADRKREDRANKKNKQLASNGRPTDIQRSSDGRPHREREGEREEKEIEIEIEKDKGQEKVLNTIVENPTDVDNFDGVVDIVDRSVDNFEPLGVSLDERAILHELKGAKGGYVFDYEKDLDKIRELSVEFPHVDIFEEVKKMAAWLIDNPKKKRNSRAFLRNWITNASKRSGQMDKDETPEPRKKPWTLKDPPPSEASFDWLCDAWNDVMPGYGLKPITERTNERRNEFVQSVKDNPDRKNPDYWFDVFHVVTSSDLMLGYVTPPDGREPWKCSLPWLLERRDKLSKLMEGFYDNKKPERMFRVVEKDRIDANGDIIPIGIAK